MKFFKIIAALLACILTVSPALAAVCATSCVATVARTSAHEQSSAHCRMMAGMSQHKNPSKLNGELNVGFKSKIGLQQVSFKEHTQSTSHKSPHNQSTHHAGCGMVGCNAIQALSLFSMIKVHFAELNTIVLTSHHILGNSADLLPPIKPPA